MMVSDYSKSASYSYLKITAFSTPIASQSTKPHLSYAIISSLWTVRLETCSLLAGFEELRARLLESYLRFSRTLRRLLDERAGFRLSSTAFESRCERLRANEGLLRFCLIGRFGLDLLMCLLLKFLVCLWVDALNIRSESSANENYCLNTAYFHLLLAYRMVSDCMNSYLPKSGLLLGFYELVSLLLTMHALLSTL